MHKKNPLDQLSLLTKSKDIYISGAAKTVLRAKNSFDLQELSRPDYIAVLKSLNRTSTMTDNVDDINTAGILNTAIDMLVVELE